MRIGIKQNPARMSRRGGAPWRARRRRPALGFALALAAILIAAPWACPQQSAASSGRAGESASSASRAPNLPQELWAGGQLLGKRTRARSGDLCLVCGNPTGKNDAAYVIHGRTVSFHVHNCLGEFERNPLKFLAQIEPHGAFLGSEGGSRALTWGWLAGGLYILLGLIFAALSAHLAIRTGHSALAWFAAGLALNAIGYLALATRRGGRLEALEGVPKGLGKVSITYAPRACPACGTLNHPSAAECAGCRRKLDPAVESEVRKAGLR